MPEYLWKHRCRTCKGTGQAHGQACDACSGSGHVPEEIEAPERLKAKCPYCKRGAVEVRKAACDGSECENATYTTLYRPCKHLVYVRCDHEAYESFWESNQLLDRRDWWLHPGFGIEEEELTHLQRDFLFDLSMVDPAVGNQKREDIPCPHAIVPFRTRALALGESEEGEGYYVALNAHGGAVFAPDPAEFVQWLLAKAELQAY